MTNKKTILVCDVNIKKKGHYIGYNQYLLNNFKEIEETHHTLNYIFLFNPEAKHLLNINHDITDRVYFLENAHMKESFINRIKVFRKVSKFASEHKVTSTIFMDLDKYQLAIALTKLSCTISGILFRPHHRITSSNATSKAKTFLKRSKKKIAEYLLLSNKKLNRVFILNDSEGAEMLNKKYDTNIFQYLSDPIFKYGELMNKREMIGEKPIYTFLVFGALNERKNITNIIKAYELAGFPYKTKLLIIGPGETDYVSYLNTLVNNLKSIGNGNKTIEIKNEYVSNEEMEYYFSTSDACLLLYKNFYGSSGLLGRAALHHLKVIAPNVGLLHQMVTQNNIGITCDPENIEMIADSLQLINNFNVQESSFQQFYQEYSPKKFIKTLLTLNL
jgi:glycosyltransferase involved in cell wall biosynthesis